MKEKITSCAAFWILTEKEMNAFNPEKAYKQGFEENVAKATHDGVYHVWRKKGERGELYCYWASGLGRESGTTTLPNLYEKFFLN